MDIKNSSGKKIGETEIKDNKIIIDNFSKPLLIIEDDIEILKKIEEKDETGFEVLFNKYNLLIGEIASLYHMTYNTVRKHMISQGINTKSKAGRRNSSYGQEFSEERKKKIGEKSRGRKIPAYERTPEIRNKISESLKNYYKENPVSEEVKQKLSDAWKRGCYENSPMGRGYNGYFYSIKNKKDFFFRSLLELSYFLKMEQDNDIEFYSVEPFQIKLPDNHHYTPDVLINGEILVELKPKRHLNYEDKKRWELEIFGAKEYCKNHNLNFKIIYDEDIGFESRQFKRWLLNNLDSLKDFNIRLNREIAWS